jgi:hypothetical protein
MAGIASLLDIEGADKTVNEEEHRVYARAPTFAKRLRFGPLRKDILNGSGSSVVLNDVCGIIGCVDEEKGEVGEESEGKRSTGKRSIESEKVRGRGRAERTTRSSTEQQDYMRF